MSTTQTEKIYALHDRYSQTIRGLPDPDLGWAVESAARDYARRVLTGIIKDCETLLETGELASHEKALVHRLLGEALSSLGAQSSIEDLERARAAFLASQQYFQVESNHLAVAALEVRVAETVATLAMLRRDKLLLLAAERRARDAAERIRELGETWS